MVLHDSCEGSWIHTWCIAGDNKKWSSSLASLTSVAEYIPGVTVPSSVYGKNLCTWVWVMLETTCPRGIVFCDGILLVMECLSLTTEQERSGWIHTDTLSKVIRVWRRQYISFCIIVCKLHYICVYWLDCQVQFFWIFAEYKEYNI